MKQFSLDKYLKNPNQKVVTRDGREVRIICIDAKLESTPIIALVHKRDKDKESLVPYSKDGKFMDDAVANCDLFFATEKHEGWVNIYSGSIKYGGEIYDTENDARNSATSDVVATVKIEWEE